MKNSPERLRDVTYRYEQVEYFDHFLRYDMEVWEHETLPIEIHQNGKVIVHSTTNLLTNPIFAFGTLSARSLLEFLGLKAGKAPYELKERKGKQKDDVVIEDFYSKTGSILKKLRPEGVNERFPKNAENVSRALWELMTDANKGTAHITDLRKEDPATYQIYRYGIEAVRILMKEYFYSQIDSEPPGPYIKMKPANQAREATP